MKPPTVVYVLSNYKLQKLQQKDMLFSPSISLSFSVSITILMPIEKYKCLTEVQREFYPMRQGDQN